VTNQITQTNLEIGEIQMKKIAILLVLLLALSIAAPLLLTQSGNASRIPTPNIVVWETNGQSNELGLEKNPEYLRAYTPAGDKFYSTTAIHITGLDEYNQSIEAVATIPNGTDSSSYFPFVDPHTNLPVAFSQITGIFQQNGTESTYVTIQTSPVPFEQYIGFYSVGTGYEPGQYYFDWSSTTGNPFYGDAPLPAGRYWQANGPNKLATNTTTEPVQPANPDPIKVEINWYCSNDHLIPQSSDISGSNTPTPVNLTIEGLDQQGRKLKENVTITPGEKTAIVDCDGNTWSDICKVWGGYAQDEYEILTHPNNSSPLFKYYIWIDHLLLYPKYYDILGNGNLTDGKTPITVVLADQDGNLVHADHDVVLNWWTSGGIIDPSYNTSILPYHEYTYANLTADSNPRTIKVVVDANVPADSLGDGLISMGERNLMAWTEMCFDGVNSVLQTPSWPLHTMTCGYDTANGSTVTMNAPFEPALEEALDLVPVGVASAPTTTLLGYLLPPYKLDGPLYEVTIPFYPGCNLISCPVYPIMANYTSEAFGGQGIPMKDLFGNTSATQTIEAIWWYAWNSSTHQMQWYTYIPGTTKTNYNFTDGLGYWIKAEKSGTLEISGVLGENAPFTPAEYEVHASWNLMGVTETNGVSISDYLQGLSMGDASFAGPVWVYYANTRTWVRNPSYGLWPTEAFWVYYKNNTVLTNPTIAP
jgi:hypothetical protein